jgi:serine/threonine-protein kinase
VRLFWKVEIARRRSVFTIVEPIAIGECLGPYRIRAVLGAGGNGVVYLAGDRRLRRPVEIKVLDPSAADPRASRLLLREARVTAGLVHPSICAVHEIGRIRGRRFIVMEHVDGSSLATVIPPGVGLPLETMLHYAIQIVDGVAHAHRLGVAHGDLKTTNIMVGSNGRLKVLDFGLAVRASPADVEQASDTTQESDLPSVRGTVPYMAPELLRGWRADARSDIWALGVVLFEMAAGCRPFQGSTSYEVAAAILGHHGVPLPSRVPEGVRRIVARCLSPVRAARYESAVELAVALDDIP